MLFATTIHLNRFLQVCCCLTLLTASFGAVSSVRLKEMARIEGVRTNDIVGYGIVVGLAGTGDSPRSKATMQSIGNALEQFGVKLDRADITSRNVASVIVTGRLQPFAEVGDQVDVSVSSLGDARSLVGGTLLLTPLKASDDKVYVLAQGQVSVGGFTFDYNGNAVQKNHPTVGTIPNGGSVERPVTSQVVAQDGTLSVVLHEADFTTATRIAQALNKHKAYGTATALHAGKVSIKLPENLSSWVEAVSFIENVELVPDKVARVVVNERTGTVVAGGDVRIDDVTISHGNLRVVISTDYLISQPGGRGVSINNTGVRSLVVPDTEISVEEDSALALDLPAGTSIADLVTALRQIKTSTRDVITILQGIKGAGALHAQLVIQ